MYEQHRDQGRVWLDVPYAEKEESGRSEPGGTRRRNAGTPPGQALPRLDRWAPAPAVPDLLPDLSK